MKTIKGDIWELYHMGYPIVVPVNIGWTKEGKAVMGRGVALDCALQFPETAERWGAVCEGMKGKVTTLYDRKYNLFYFPTKPFNAENPHLSWKGHATLETVKQSLADLIKCAQEVKLGDVVIPLVGCGNGGLSPKVVRKIMSENLDDTFTLVEL